MKGKVVCENCRFFVNKLSDAIMKIRKVTVYYLNFNTFKFPIYYTLKRSRIWIESYAFLTFTFWLIIIFLHNIISTWQILGSKESNDTFFLGHSVNISVFWEWSLWKLASWKTDKLHYVTVRRAWSEKKRF